MTAEPSLDVKVAALGRPAAYAEQPARIDTVETHMSWVFLTPRHAYKLKKSRRFDHLDFSTPTARLFYCLEELRLNRRLAPDVYLDVVPLTLEDNGSIVAEGKGQAIDWLVKMRRLPIDRMLDKLLERRLATPEDMRRIAGRLAGFYAQLPAAALDTRAYRASLESQIADYESDLLMPAWDLPPAAIRSLCNAQRAFIAQEQAMLDERVREGRIVEGHGDLRPEHICVNDSVLVIDALEFSGALRTLDCADEIGFLMLECERAGAPLLAHALRHWYEDISGDAPPHVLLHFYQSCRAASRARLAIRHLAEERYRSQPVWTQRTQAYLGLAQRHITAAMPA